MKSGLHPIVGVKHTLNLVSPTIVSIDDRYILKLKTEIYLCNLVQQSIRIGLQEPKTAEFTCQQTIEWEQEDINRDSFAWWTSRLNGMAEESWERLWPSRVLTSGTNRHCHLRPRSYRRFHWCRWGRGGRGRRRRKTGTEVRPRAGGAREEKLSITQVGDTFQILHG